MPPPSHHPQPKVVWLIEDNVSLRRTVARVVAAVAGCRCGAEFLRCEDALAALRKPAGPPPDLVLLDVGLPGMNGIDGITLLKEAAPHTQIVILTVFEDDEKIYRAICAGASGYLIKDASLAELTTAITSVLRGGSPMTPRVARRVLEMFSKLAPRLPNTSPLSPREHQIVESMAEGLTNKEIATRLGLSAHTIDDYTRAIYGKLHVHSRSGAVGKALREGLV